MAGLKTAVGERHSKPKALTSMEVREAEPNELEEGKSGGHIVMHNFDNSGSGSYHDPEKHSFPEGQGAALLSHIADHLHIKMPDMDESEEKGE
jgi:hypothetical protein